MSLLFTQANMLADNYQVVRMVFTDEDVGRKTAFFIVYEGSRRIGFCCCKLEKNIFGRRRAALKQLAILPAYQEKKVAQLLIKKSQEWAKKAGYEKFVVTCKRAALANSDISTAALSTKNNLGTLAKKIWPRKFFP